MYEEFTDNATAENCSECFAPNSTIQDICSGVPDNFSVPEILVYGQAMFTQFIGKLHLVW